MSRRRKEREQHEVSRGVIAILLLLFAIISFLSFFNQAGTLGIIINEWILSFFFGSIRFVVPVVIIVLAWYLVTDKKYNYRPTHGIGALLFFLTTSSLLHLHFPLETMWQQALDGNGGGVFGMLAWLLKTYLGSIASVVVLIGLIVISLILMFNTSIAHFVTIHKRLMEKMGFVGSGIKQSVDTLFVEQEEEERRIDEADEEDNEEDTTEEEERSFTRKRVQEDDEELSEEDDTEEEEETEESADDSDPKTHLIPAEPTMPFWQQHVIIRKPPSVSLLEVRKDKPTSGDIDDNQRIIKDTFREFKIEVEMQDVRVGPTVTQYTMKPARGVKLTRITTLGNDLALALAAHPIRIEAPIPGKSLVGIEVPNNKTAVVSLRELIESKEYKKRKHNLMIGLGKDVAGTVWFADLPRMPHLLIAGSTGSGKTVCMNTIITSLLYQNTAQELRFIMVDPKRVELTLYNGIPHLLTPVITDTKKTINALRWTIAEMDRRFDVLSKAGNRDIGSYNQAHPKEKLPHIIFIIDELADLMVTASADVETGIIRIAQMARAVGIHLIVATQRPSVDVITGLMKANIPARIAFSVASLTDSRTILDTSGAEKLIGKGDMLLMTSDFSKPVRIQGAYISEKETKDIIDYLRGDDEPVYDESITDKQSSGSTPSMFGGPDDDQDSLFEEAKHAIIESKKASASFLQRKLKVGYARAARLLDELEEAGVIGPANGAKPRDILLSEKDMHSMDAGQSLNVYKQRDERKPVTPAQLDTEEIDEEEPEEDDALDEEDEDDMHTEEEQDDNTDADDTADDRDDEPLDDEAEEDSDEEDAYPDEEEIDEEKDTNTIPRISP